MSYALRRKTETYIPISPPQAPHADVLGTSGAAASGGHRQRFAQLIESASQEITGRFPDYFAQFPVEVQSISALAREVHSLPVFEKFSTAELELALVRGLQVLDDLGVSVNLDSPQSDTISRVMVQSIFDAYAAVRDAVDLRPSLDGASHSGKQARERYSVGQTRSGVPFAFSHGEGRPPLIVSNTGVPLNIWSNLIHDVTFRRPWIAVPSRAGSLLEGGTPNPSSLAQDVADCREILSASELDQVDIVAWGNGARTAIALTREIPEQVKSLLLVSPTFYGARATEKYPSPFEDFLVEAYEIANRDTVSGWCLIEALPHLGMWDARAGSLPRNARRRVESVLRLPPQSCLESLFAPFSCVEYFRNYVERVLADGVYDIGAALWEIRCPMVLLTGTNDAAANTQLARDLLATYGHDVLQATLSGAGHHIQVLQYGYFRHLLDGLARRSGPVSTARLRVERLA